MKTAFNFDIQPAGPVSRHFLDRGITDFASAALFIRHLPYRRNADKNDLTSVFRDQCGTCSTKHAVLRQLAVEHAMEQVRLKLGIFKMNRRNTPRVAVVLDRYGLDFMPEAHNYLLVEDAYWDCTNPRSKPDDFIDDLLTEIEIQPQQIGNFKVEFHQNYLEHWLKENHSVFYSLSELWAIREECIQALSATGYLPDTVTA